MAKKIKVQIKKAEIQIEEMLDGRTVPEEKVYTTGKVLYELMQVMMEIDEEL